MRFLFQYTMKNFKAKKQSITTVNFHPLLQCNMACVHCFAAGLSKDRLNTGDACKIVKLIAEAGFSKINIAGGEPLLHPGLDQLIHLAKALDLTTSIVTNGTRITGDWLRHMSEYLDIIALSIDSINPEIHRLSGRAVGGRPILNNDYLLMGSSIKEHGIRLKINTVITKYNFTEDMTEFIHEMKPERWKIMHSLPIIGQNDHNINLFEITNKEFAAYVKRNGSVKGIIVVAESNDLMRNSYVMVDPQGRFFDNNLGTYTYSRPILKVGVSEALQDVKIDPEKFVRRGGLYD